MGALPLCRNLALRFVFFFAFFFLFFFGFFFGLCAFALRVATFGGLVKTLAGPLKVVLDGVPTGGAAGEPGGLHSPSSAHGTGASGAPKPTASPPA